MKKKNTVKELFAVEFQFSWNSWSAESTNYNTQRNTKAFCIFFFFTSIYVNTNLGTHEPMRFL